jgi:benzoyl-CoA 2,3-dioxygenase component A
MGAPIKQHLIDPEICIRCHTCEDACTIGAISHNDDNVVVDASICSFCMDCIAPCPTGSIDNWRITTQPYSVKEQLGWLELPEQTDITETAQTLDTHIADLLAEAHAGAGSKTTAPASASKPSTGLFTSNAPLTARVQGNYRLTDPGDENDVRHIILDLGSAKFPVLEGQTVGITAPGQTDSGKPHPPRLYSVSSPRNGERPGFNNLSLTVKRETKGLCSNYICDLGRDDSVNLSGPYGDSFLIPNDPDTTLLMICTGTGAAPFRAFTMHRQRSENPKNGQLALYFGARTPESLPYFGPLNKIPDAFMTRRFAFSRLSDQPKTYVQDLLRKDAIDIADHLCDPNFYIYLCGLKDMEEGIENTFQSIANSSGLNWPNLKSRMCAEGRYHVETY